MPTIGVEFATKPVPLKTGGTVRVQIWDTGKYFSLFNICCTLSAGQERFKAITSAHYRKSLGALLVYDITKEQSFKNIEKWISEVKEHAEPDIVLMLVGNKLDIC